MLQKFTTLGCNTLVLSNVMNLTTPEYMVAKSNAFITTHDSKDQLKGSNLLLLLLLF